MALLCPLCSGGTLRITAALELPPDARSDEITLQLVRCSGCGLRAAALYEESRRGAGESVDHVAFRPEPGVLAALEREIRACPEPKNPRCSCPTHTKYAGGAHHALVSERLPIRFRR